MPLPPEKIEDPRPFSPPIASQSEEAFVQGLRRGEEWAYRKLVQEWTSKLYHLAYRFLKREEEAKEVVQDVFRKVFEKIDSFKGDSKISTWLYRVTVNEALMRVRSRRGDPEVSWEEVLPKFEDGIWTDRVQNWAKLPEAALLEKEAQAFIQQCIQELPESYRAPYLLKDVEQLSENEVCQILGLEKSVMKVRVHRARLFLRKKIEKHYVR